LLESKTASRLLESTCWNLKMHAGIHNGIISACWNPKLHHFCVLKSKSASFPPDGINLHCLRQLESKTASFPPAGIQNCIISACWNPKLHHFRLLESRTALLLRDGIENCIISACLNPPVLFPPTRIQTASFPPTGIQNGIISAY
jgi:hypothetical protein